MNIEFPYQVVAFLNKQPAIGENVYYGEGWYPQIALKRRFKSVDLHEDKLISQLGEYFSSKNSFSVETKELIRDSAVFKPLLKPVTSAPIDTLNSAAIFLSVIFFLLFL